MSSKLSFRPMLFTLLLTVAAVSVQGDVHFYYFIQRWPASSCRPENGRCCYPKTGKPLKDFVVHGLRPYNLLNQGLINCDRHDQLDPSKISNLTGDLERHWPSLSCPRKSSSMGLWSYEWRKYGTCTKADLDQYHYFRAAINLKKKVDLLYILGKAGIKPDGRFYAVSDAVEAIRRELVYDSIIYCIKDKWTNTPLLHLISLCSAYGDKVNDCPGLDASTCGSAFMFPPF